MHVGGAPGSGKTYLGKQLKSKYQNLKVIDTDMLKDKFIEKPIPENMEIMEKLANFDPNKKKTKAQISLEKNMKKIIPIIYKINLINYINKNRNIY